MKSALRFSQLTPARQRLVRMLQAIDFGEIAGIVVRDGDVILDGASELIFDRKLDQEQPPRPEQQLRDFDLCTEITRLMLYLEEIQNGTILRLEVRAGIPRRIQFTTFAQ